MNRSVTLILLTLTTLSACGTAIDGDSAELLQRPSALLAENEESLFDNSVVPSRVADSDSGAVELGVKFRPNVAGQVKGIRFYKSERNLGTHIGNLWSAAGSRLASIKFVNESASGWQRADFASPVVVEADKIYVASYFAPRGRYSADNGFFSGSGLLRDSLYALRDGEWGGNGVYRYGLSSRFPSQSYRATNYYVDVVFVASGDDDVTPEAPAQLSAVQLEPASVVGGTDVSVSIVLSAAAPEGGAAITLTSSRPKKATVPAQLVVPGGQKTASFIIKTRKVASSRQAIITAKYNGVSRSAKLMLLAGDPPASTTFLIQSSAGVGGAISPAGSISVASGAMASFAITPNSGYQVASVLVDGVSIGAASTYAFTNVKASHSIRAAFALTSTTPPPPPPAAVGNLYYVSPTGSDGASGGELSPWRTLQKAANTVVAGDTVIVRAGTYVGMNRFGKSGGTADKPIQFIAEPGVVVNRVSTTGTNASLAEINIEASGDYYVVKGFKIVGGGGEQRAGIRISGGTGSRIANNTVTGAYIGIFVSNTVGTIVEDNECSKSTDQHGIYMGGANRNHIVRRNKLHDNNWDGLHLNCLVGSPNDGGLVEDNEIWGNNLSGMDLEGISNTMVRNNVIHDNGKHGITLHSQDQANTPESQNNRFVNNTIAFNGMFGIQIQNPDLKGETIFNNIFVTSGSLYGAIGVGTSNPTGLTSDYNVVIDSFSTALGNNRLSLASWRNTTGQDQHSVVVDSPASLFTNASAADFSLSAMSLAIDRGVASLQGFMAPLVDFEDVARPRGASFDAGAYER